MKGITLGKTGVVISKLGLGSWAIGGGSYWGDNNDEESIRTIHAALDNGINLIDTAPVYGFGHSERVVGQAVRDRRPQVLIATKCGLNWDEARKGSFHSRDGAHTVYRNLTAPSIRRDVEDSLDRLGTDYIDICITHWQAAPEFPTPVEETVGELVKMKEEGLIRAIGASNVSEDIVREYLRYGQLDIIQERYSMLDRKNEKLFQLCWDEGIAVMAYSPLEQGLLTGKYPRGFADTSGSARLGKEWFQPKPLGQLWDMMDQWSPLCEKYDCTLAQLAIAWTAAQADNLQVLCGGRTLGQIMDNVRGGELQLDTQDAAYMRTLAETAAPLS